VNHWLTQSALLAAATAPMPDTTLWAQWGLAGLVVGGVMWQSWRREQIAAAAIKTALRDSLEREKRLGQRIDELEDRQMELIERGVRADEALAAAINRMADRPCQLEESRK